MAVGLSFFGTVDAIEADPFRAIVVQDFDGIAVEDGNCPHRKCLGADHRSLQHNYQGKTN